MKANKLKVLLLGAYFFTQLVFAANPSSYFDEEGVILTGTVKVKVFPAPPKNEDIGDKEEIYRYLILDHPIDVFDKKNNSDSQENIETIHIVPIDDSWSDQFINKHVRVIGKLYSRVIRTVMLVNKFEIIK